jgi:hypothetical protein
VGDGSVVKFTVPIIWWEDEDVVYPVPPPLYTEEVKYHIPPPSYEECIIGPWIRPNSTTIRAVKHRQNYISFMVEVRGVV